MGGLVIKKLSKLNKIKKPLKKKRSVYKPRESKPLTKQLTRAIQPKPRIVKPGSQYKMPPTQYRIPDDIEIFAYCSKNYKDAFDFVVPSWIKIPSVSKITVYTDWDYDYKHDKVEIIKMFEPSSDWIVGTGRRLDVIKHYSYVNKGSKKYVLFLDIDCYIVRDINEVFQYDFDIAITRLKSDESHANKTATAGLWFARLSTGYYNFIEEWFKVAKELKKKKVGLRKHYISYVQYSFTEVARRSTKDYNVLPIDENIYNSEHSDISKWFSKIKKFKPKILHFKGRRFRDVNLVNHILKLSGVRK